MEVQITDYMDVQKRAVELSCNVPTGLAILPRNFETAESKEELFHEDATIDIRNLWRQNQVVETRLEGEGRKFPSIQEKSFEWIGPTIFISASLLSQNSTLVNVALSVLANYVTDFFKGHLGEHTVSVNLVLEEVKKHGEDEERNYKQVNLTGTAGDLNKLNIDNIKKLVEE
jgi:hypothetical protein